MCRQTDALDARIQAARCLSEACASRIGVMQGLRAIYDPVLAEGIPPDLRRLLDELGKEEADG